MNDLLMVTQHQLAKIVDCGIFSTVPKNELSQSAYAITLTRETFRNGVADMKSETHHYARLTISALKTLCNDVKAGKLRSMEVVGALYSLGIILPKSQKIGSAWDKFARVTSSQHVEIDKAYRYLIKHAKEAIANSPDGKFVYSESYYNATSIYRSAFDKQEVELGRVRAALRERAPKEQSCKVHSYAVPKGVQTLCVYRNTRNGAKLHDILVLSGNKLVSLLDSVTEISSIPVTLSRGDVAYAQRTNSISGTKYDMFAVSGVLAVPKSHRKAAKKLLQVKSVNEIVNRLLDGTWAVKKPKPLNDKKSGLRLRNANNPGEYVTFVATNVYGVTPKSRLRPIDLVHALGQHLSSAGFITLDSTPRANCLYLRAEAVQKEEVQKTVNCTKQLAETSLFKIDGIVFRINTANSANFFARLPQ